MLRRLLARLREKSSRRHPVSEFDEELQFHLEREIENHRSRGFTALAASAWSEISIKLPTEDFPEHLPARQVTANFFEVLQTPPVIGRAFESEHEIAGRNHVAVISYELWQRRFGGRSDVLGRQ